MRCCFYLGGIHMIIPTTHNLDDIIKGTTYDPEAMVIIVDGLIKNLTGCVVSLVIHKADVITATLTDGAGLVVDPTNGTIAPYLTVAQTSAYTADQYDYYLNIVEPDGTTIYRYTEGIVEVRA